MYRLFFKNETTLKKKYWLFLVSLIFFDGIAAITPILLGYLIDHGLKENSFTFLIFFGIIILLFVLIRLLGSYFNVIHLDLTANLICNHRKSELYQKIHEFDPHFFHDYHVGELLNTLNTDWDHIRVWFAYCIKTITFQSIHFFIAFCYFSYCSFSMTLCFVLLSIIPAILIYRFFKRIYPFYHQLREENADFTRHIQDFIDGNRVLKSFHTEQYESKLLQEENERIKSIEYELSEKRNAFFTIIRFFSYFLSIVFVIFIVFLFFKKNISIGVVLILNSLLYYLQEPFLKMNDFLDYYQKAKISMNKINKILNYQTKIVDEEKRSINSLLSPIVFQNVSVTIDEKEVLKHINLIIEPKSTVAFVGLTGSGKSTIINLLERFINPSEGNIYIDDKPIQAYDLKEYRSKIGYVFQEPFLFSDTILNNIFYGSHYSKKKLDELIKICNLDFVLHYPKKFHTMIGEKGVGLSGGEKQRVSLARAIAKNPEILILDDMTSALDIETEFSIISSIYNMKEEMTKIIIAEKIVSVEHADIIYVLDDGNIIESGTHQELLKKEGYYYQMYQMQRRK